MKTKCVMGYKTCKGPYAASDPRIFVCYECSLKHDEKPANQRCRCDEHKGAST